VLIIGYGNPLRCDDGLGWHAALQLQHIRWEIAVEVQACHQLTPELAASISAADCVIFIDACCESAAVCATQDGPVCCQRLAPAVAAGNLAHHLDPAALLALADTLYYACPEAYLCTLPGTTFAYGETLSDAVQTALPLLLERVRQLVASAA
jgi:hydrogenase maturation protease